MANLGFHRLMAERGIRVVTTDVGDRYVLEALKREGGVLGGEQSGHIIYLKDHVTGDGLAAALLLCCALDGRKLSEATAVLERYPQAKANVPVSSKELTDAARGGRAAQRRARPGRPCSRASIGDRARRTGARGSLRAGESGQSLC